MVPAASKMSSALRRSRSIPEMGGMPRSTRTLETSLTKIASHPALAMFSTMPSIRHL
jgi:hypothetical protein